MTVLTKENSRVLLLKLFSQFGYDEKSVDNYLTAKSLLGWHREPPLLWYPQKSTAKFILEIYDDVITFDTRTASGNYVQVENEVILPRFIELLNQLEVKNVYGLGVESDDPKNVVCFSPAEFPDIRKRTHADGYFFPEDMQWLYCMTHENFSFLAGTGSFINKFKQLFPDYAHYLLDEPILSR